MYAVVLLPDFSLQCALRQTPEIHLQSVALITEAARAGVPVVSEVNDVAAACGVVNGMSVPQAQARCLELVLLRNSPAQEAIATTALLQAAERASPYLESTRPGCCTLDLRRHGELDHAAWANDLVAELAALHLCAQVGIASTPDAALQVARIACPVQLAADPLTRLARLPVAVFEPSDELLDVLSDWGIERVADLCALDRQEVAARLGVEGTELWDRATGGATRPLCLVRAAETYEEQVEFEGGVETLEPMLFRLRRSLEQLVQRLRADMRLAGSIDLTLVLDDRTEIARTIHIPTPTCEVDVLFRVASTYLETVQTDSCVSGFRLQAWPTAPRDHQAHLWEASLRDPNRFSETLARLSGIVGAEHVGTPCRMTTHKPNRFRLKEADFGGRAASTAKARAKVPSAAPGTTFPPLGPCLRRCRPPRRIAVESRDARPVSVCGRDLVSVILAVAGPWRLDGDWWDLDTVWGWEEWDVELTMGGLYRLACHRQTDWWMLGTYD